MTTSPPLIDISPLRTEPESPEARACIESIHHASTRSGFLVVVGHGLDEQLEGVFQAAHTFFALPQAEKEAFPKSERYGYVPHKSLAIDRSRVGEGTEFIDIGLGDEWPLPDLPGFNAAVRAYQRGILDVAAITLRAIAIALELEPGFFAQYMASPQCRLRFLHYLVAPLNADGSLPVGTKPHTDYGAITLLATDGVPGLEVKPLGGDWTPVVTPPKSLVINLGDMLARWTNNRYKSTPHRVIGSSTQDRFSIPFFANPNPETVIECIPSCVTEENPCQYDPVKAGEFLVARIDGKSEPYVDPREGPARMVSL